MWRAPFILFTLVVCASCAGTTSPGAQRQSTEQPYYRQIREWQQRIEKEGWAENRVEQVLNWSLGFVTYEMEIDDHWATPKEFVRNGFRGDCEDIAIFLMGTLKRLNYPHRIRILAVTGVFENHALLKVEMPDGTWKIYDTYSDNPYSLHAYYRPLVEFDEKNIFSIPPL